LSEIRQQNNLGRDFPEGSHSFVCFRKVHGLTAMSTAHVHSIENVHVTRACFARSLQTAVYSNYKNTDVWACSTVEWLTEFFSHGKRNNASAEKV